jgi:microcystin-dependent protein
MSNPFVGEIRIFAGTFAPLGWAFCDGQLLAVSQNDALFALLGTVYGGDGRTTFGLPDLRGRIPIHYGQGPGLSSYAIGQGDGVENVILTTAELPAHEHSLVANSAAANVDIPNGAVPADSTQPTDPLANHSYKDNAFTDEVMSHTNLTGGSQAHNNMMPYLCASYIIALFGIFPSRA